MKRLIFTRVAVYLQSVDAVKDTVKEKSNLFCSQFSAWRVITYIFVFVFILKTHGHHSYKQIANGFFAY